MIKSRQDRLIMLKKARSLNYKLYRINPWNYVLKKKTKKSGEITFNLYWNKRNNLYTVQTALTHTIKGKGLQMNRKGLTVEEVKKLLNNPRMHTGKGYKTKKYEKKVWVK